MKIYKTKAGIVVEHQAKFFLVENENWDEFINDDDLFQKALNITLRTPAAGNELIKEVLALLVSRSYGHAGLLT